MNKTLEKPFKILKDISLKLNDLSNVTPNPNDKESHFERLIYFEHKRVNLLVGIIEQLAMDLENVEERKFF